MLDFLSVIYIYIYVCMSPNFYIGLGLMLGSQFTYIVGNGFPTMGSSQPSSKQELLNNQDSLPSFNSLSYIYISSLSFSSP